MDELTIGEVARQVGVRPSAIRYYESISLLPSPRRVSGQRRYTQDTVKVLKVIQVAQHAGFSMAEIKLLLNGFAADTPASARWQALARPKLDELDARIEQLESMRRM